VAWSSLSAEDRNRVQALFANSKPVNANLYYRITREGPSGRESIEVLPEAAPAALIASVKTILD